MNPAFGNLIYTIFDEFLRAFKAAFDDPDAKATFMVEL